MPFREKVTELGEKGLQIIEEYFDGKRHGTDMVREASKMVSQAVKIEHMNQIPRRTRIGLLRSGFCPFCQKTKRSEKNISK